MKRQQQSKLRETLAYGAGLGLLVLFFLDCVFDFKAPKLRIRGRQRP